MDAEILLLAFDGPGDRVLGSVVEVKYCEPGTEPIWGRAERQQGDRFFRIRVTGVEDGELDYLKRGVHYTEFDTPRSPDEPPPEKLRFRSRFLLRPTDLPAQAQTDLSENKIPVITKDELEDCIFCRKFKRKLQKAEVRAGAEVAKLKDPRKNPIDEIEKKAKELSGGQIGTV